MECILWIILLNNILLWITMDLLLNLWVYIPGYALDPSIDNYEVPTKYIGSVEEAEKNQGK